MRSSFQSLSVEVEAVSADLPGARRAGCALVAGMARAAMRARERERLGAEALLTEGAAAEGLGEVESERG